MAEKTMTLREKIIAKGFINPKTLTDDMKAGLVLGIQSVPSGLAQGFLAFINPIYGLYGYMMGIFTGAFFTSSHFMTINATSAIALIVASVPQVHHPEYGGQAVFTLSILTGLIMLLTGLFKLGTLIRFVPNAVMTGFINAIGLLIILGQLDDFTGYMTYGPNKIAQAIDLFFNMDQIDFYSLIIGLVTIILMLTLEKTKLGPLGLVTAMIVASFLVALFGWDSVQILNDLVEIPNSLPNLVFPDINLIPVLIVPAFSMAFVGLVQGASISKNFMNPDGKYPDVSGDFVGQGMANLFSGLFQGMPVSGSYAATTFITNAGAKSRFANIFAGIVMALIIILFGNFIGYIAMPALAGLLIIIGFRMLNPQRVRMVWKTGRVQQTVLGITFFSCLIIPLQYAVLVGIAISLLLFVIDQSNDIIVKQWIPTENFYPIEKDAPETVPANEATLLVIYGSFFFATAPLVEQKLPDVGPETDRAAVVLAMRQNRDLGSTFLQVLERYAIELNNRDSKLIIAGVTPDLLAQLERTGLIQQIDRESIFVEGEAVGESVLAAWKYAQKWVASGS